MNRGVSVSQIKPLLDTPLPKDETLDSDWQVWRQAMNQAISELKPNANWTTVSIRSCRSTLRPPAVRAIVDPAAE